MNPYPHEPLTTEERELAQLTSRLPPHGEPSPALDARILAAAHAATAPQPVRKHKPRWPVALGLAASVVFAVGIAWQLRPLQEQGALLAEVPAAAEASEQAAPVANVAAVPEAFPQAAADAMSASEAAPADTAPAQTKAVVTPPAEASARNRSQPAPVFAPAPAPAKSKVLARETAPRRQEADSYIPPAPPSPPAPVASPPPAPAPVATAPPPPVVLTTPAPMADASLPLAATAEAEAALAEHVSVVTARSTAKARTDNSRSKAASAREAKMRSASAAPADNATLDRVEVSGSRLRTDLQVPVVDDTHLAVNDWLERVRTRYGLGDAAAARQSLLLFVRDHPRENVPDDLEPLLKE